MRFKQAVVFTIAAVLAGGLASPQAQAQQMLLLSSRVTGTLNDPIPFDIIATGNIGSAVSWGTTINLSNTAASTAPPQMSFAYGLDSQGNPYRSLESFFDTDFSDTSAAGNGQISLNFLNTTPGANLGYNGLVELAEFQVLLGSATPKDTDLTVSLAGLGVPPYGSAVQDDTYDNLLTAGYPANYGGPASLAHLYVTGSGQNIRWFLGSPPPAEVPEPTAWMIGTAGIAAGFGLLRRRRA